MEKVMEKADVASYQEIKIRLKSDLEITLVVR